MHRMLGIFVGVITGVLHFLHIAPVACAGLITSLSVEVSPGAGGQFRYDYTLTNESTSDLPVIGFALDIAATADLTNLIGPSGWNVSYSTGDTVISWESPDPSTDLLPGFGAVFSFLSPLEPGLSDYLILGLDENTGRFETNFGQIAGPGPSISTIPEPSSILLACIGLLGFIGLTRWRSPAATAT